MEVVQVAQYVSDSSDEEVLEENNGIHRNEKNKKRRTKYWVKESVFDNAGEAEASIENIWLKRDLSSTNAKIFATEPTICLKLWTSSYQWAKSTKDIICTQNDVSKQYIIPVRNLESITKADLNKYINKNGQPLISLKNHMIFGVWKCRMIQIGKHQNATVQLFLKTTYVNTLLVWLFV